MTSEERKPIYQDSGVYTRIDGSGVSNKSEQQHLIIQPVEFDHKHRNMYGYLAAGAFLLVLINYLMLKERACQISLGAGYTNFDLLQSFHMTTLIIAIIVFVLSYFNFAVVIYEFKLLFYVAAGLIFVCSGLLIYSAVTILSMPCVPLNNNANTFVSLLDASFITGSSNIFAAGDGIGITVFFFDIAAAIMMFLSGRRFYQKC